MNLIKITTLLPLLVIGLTACNGGGSSSPSNNAVAAPAATGRISGTVPGTVIEAYADNGQKYTVNSTNNGTARHPFSLDLPSGMGYRLVMITNEGTADEVVTPIGFLDSTGATQTRLQFQPGVVVDLGNIPLAMSRNAAAADDLNNDGVLDAPLVLDHAGANNPLTKTDADGDGVMDYSDQDHGGYAYANGINDPQDADHDGVPNLYEDSDNDGQINKVDTDIDGDGVLNADDTDHNGDSDHDGLPNVIDADSATRIAFDNNRDGYLDDDLNHDGFHDDDRNRDGLHDDDLNKDGYHDDDSNHDGLHDDDLNKDGFHDDDLNHDGEHDNH